MSEACYSPMETASTFVYFLMSRTSCQRHAIVPWKLLLLLFISNYIGLDVNGMLKSYGHYVYCCLFDYF